MTSRHRLRNWWGSRAGNAFSLIELLVVVSLVLFLVGLLLPGLSGARGQTKAAVCQSNIRQLVLANGMYAQESGGAYVPGAAEYVKKNLDRWHGRRKSVNEAFESSEGLLTPYLGSNQGIRACPTFEPERTGFEAGNGGYGYNNAYVGVQMTMNSQIRDLAGTVADRVKRPGETVMFSDSAFVDGQLIEYSFAEPRFHPSFASRADPSIHFRHHRTCNVAWCDGHVSRERRTFTWSSGLYEGNPERFDIGWFGEADGNSLFDLQ